MTNWDVLQFDGTRIKIEDALSNYATVNALWALDDAFKTLGRHTGYIVSPTKKVDAILSWYHWAENILDSARTVTSQPIAKSQAEAAVLEFERKVIHPIIDSGAGRGGSRICSTRPPGSRRNGSRTPRMRSTRGATR